MFNLVHVTQLVSDVDVATEAIESVDELLPISGHGADLQEALIEAQIESPKKEDSPEPVVKEEVDSVDEESFVEVAKEVVEEVPLMTSSQDADNYHPQVYVSVFSPVENGRRLQ